LNLDLASAAAVPHGVCARPLCQARTRARRSCRGADARPSRLQARAWPRASRATAHASGNATETEASSLPSTSSARADPAASPSARYTRAPTRRDLQGGKHPASPPARSTTRWAGWGGRHICGVGIDFQMAHGPTARPSARPFGTAHGRHDTACIVPVPAQPDGLNAWAAGLAHDTARPRHGLVAARGPARRTQRLF
jgi:hypothetical protein